MIGDETWVLYINTETKQQSLVWDHTASSYKVPQALSDRKVMATVFWDAKGILLVELKSVVSL